MRNSASSRSQYVRLKPFLASHMLLVKSVQEEREKKQCKNEKMWVFLPEMKCQTISWRGAAAKRAGRWKRKGKKRDLFSPAFSISRENGMHECRGPDSASPVRFHKFEPWVEKKQKKKTLFLSLPSAILKRCALIHKDLGR